MIWAAIKYGIQALAGKAGYRIVPWVRDANSLREWLLLQPIRTVVDVGASTGETSREWLRRLPSVMVHAIEPLPSSFALLETLRKQNRDRLRTYNYAIGRTIGKVEFRLHTLHHTSSSLLPRTDHSARILPDTEKEIVIDATITTLDDLFSDKIASLKGEILVKLDVQGVESDVIAGASQFLKHVKYVLTEVSLAPVYIGQSDFSSVHAAMTQAGFVLQGFLEQSHVADLSPLYVDVLYVNKDV